MSRSIVFFGSTKLSEEILVFLIKKGITIKAIFSIPKEFKISYSEKKVNNSNYADLSKYAVQLNIPYYEVESTEEKRITNYVQVLKELSPDVILALGWYYMVPKIIREIPVEGVWGIHASLLPNYAGGAPLVWAIINGETQTGVTLFRMDSGVDDGDIIYQRKLSIDKKDTIKTMIKKSAVASKAIILKSLLADKIKYKPQDKSKIIIYPQRSPKDGEIDWSWDSEKIENFVRAQTKPYPGAWTMIDNKKVIFWDISIKNQK